MSVLNSYAQHLMRIDAQAIVLEAGQPLRARFADGERVANTPVDSATLVSGVMESVPFEMAPTVQRGRPVRFALDEDDNQFQVDVDPSPTTGWRVTITRKGASRVLRPVDPNEIEFTPHGPPIKRSRTIISSSMQAARRDSLAPGSSAVPGAPFHPGTSIAPGSSALAAPGIPSEVSFQGDPRVAPSTPPLTKRSDPSHAVGSLRLERLVQRMIVRSARIAHLATGAPALVRMPSGLQPLDANDPPLEDSTMRAMLSALVPQSQRDELERNRFLSLTVESAGHRCFATVRADRDGWAIALRRIAASPPLLANLHVPDEVRALALATRGLVLLCGNGASVLGHALVSAVSEQRDARTIVFESATAYAHDAPGRVLQCPIPPDGRAFGAQLGVLACDDVDLVLVDPWVAPEAIVPVLDLCASGRLVVATVPGADRIDAIARIVAGGREYARRVLPRHVAGIVSVTVVPSERSDVRLECGPVLGASALASLNEGQIERLEIELELAEAAPVLQIE